MRNYKKALSGIFIILFTFVLIIGTFGILTNIYLPHLKPAYGEDYQGFSKATDRYVDFQAESDIKLMHFTDTHYIPTRLFFNGDKNNPNFNSYKNEIISAPYIGLEAAATFRAALKNAKQDIISQNIDFIILSGDITKNAERLGHIDVANALRNLQNEVRVSNPNFQIFVTPGNHDFYNQKAADFSSGKKELAETITRKEFFKIYSSLGFPDILDSEVSSVYSSDELKIAANLPYTPTGNTSFVNSTTSPIVNYTYQFEGDINNAQDIGIGDLSYVARFDDTRLSDYVIISVDGALSSEEAQHVVGGTISAATHDFLLNLEGLDDKTVISVTHHNLLPHYTFEDSLTKDFTLYNYAFWRDLFSDIGVRYNFSGHMHSNDIQYDMSFNNEIIYDIETPSLFGGTSAYRVATIERGSTLVENNSPEVNPQSVISAMKNTNNLLSSVDGKLAIYAENVKTEVITNKNVDFTYEIENNYIPMYYIEANNTQNFFGNYNAVSGKFDGTKPYVVNDIGNYAMKKHYLNIINNIRNVYITPEFINDLLKNQLPQMLKDVDNSIVKSIAPLAGKMAESLVLHLDNVVLEKYTYKGSNPLFTDNKNKTVAYIDELFDRILKIEVAPSTVKGEKPLLLEEFLLELYSKHLNGTDVSSFDKLPEQYKIGLNNLKNGKLINELLNKLLDEKNGLLKLVRGLLEPIDFTTNLTNSEQKLLQGTLGLLGVKDLSTVKLDNVITKVLPLLPFEIPFDMSNGLGNLIDTLLEDYLTTSLYTGLGNIAYDIGYSFSVDASYDGVMNQSFRFNYFDNLAYVNIERKSATIANGKLPSMITNNFGSDPTTTRNFTYFTTPKVEDTYIYISENLNGKYRPIEGESDVICVTTPSIDLGIFATTMTTELRRHTVNLTGLKPDTVYNYKLGSKKFKYFSPTYTFKTAKDNGAFNALLLTDTQGFSQNTYDIVKNSLGLIDQKFDYDLILSGGDMVDNSKNVRQFEYLFNTLSDTFANYPFITTAGNHEEHTYEHDSEYVPLYDGNTDSYNYLLSHFNYDLPTQNTDNGFYYSFDYSNVHFTVLNTNALDRQGLVAQQLEWLKEDLESSNKSFKVVLMHKGIYTSGSHSFEKEIVVLRDQLKDVFIKNGVNLVIQGHDHTYNETKFIDKNGKEISVDRDNNKIKLKKDATMFVTLGTLGDKFYNYKDNSLIPEDFGKTKHYPTLTNPTFGFLEFDGENLYYSGYEVKGGKIVSIYEYNFLGLAVFIVLLLLILILVAFIIKDRKDKIKKNTTKKILEKEKSNYYPPKPKW